MALVTFDEIDASNPNIKSLTFEPAAQSVVRTPEQMEAERQNAAEVAQRSVWGAAFQEDNTVASFLARETAPTNKIDPEFDFFKYVKDNKLEGQEDLFMDAMNQDYADYLNTEMQRKQRNRETLAAAGWAGTLASIAAGTLDLPTLLPGGAAIKGAKGGYSIAKTALLGSVAAAGGAGVSELALQETQTGRAPEESYLNIGAAVLLGGMFGGAAAAALSRGERAAATAAMDRLYAAAEPGGAVRLERQGLSAEAVNDPDVDLIDVMPREALAVEGKATNQIVRATRWLNPTLRSTQRYAASARQFGAMIYENTIYRAMHGEGKSLGASVETLARMQQEARVSAYARTFKDTYKEMKRAGVKLSRDEFDRQIGLAIHLGDQSDNPFVAKAAAALRKEIIQPFTDEALRTQRSDASFLLTERDLDLKGTADSYGPTIPNVNTLRGQEAEWLNVVGERVARRMEEAKAEEDAALAARLQGYDTQISDLSAAGVERDARISEVTALGDKMDSEFADVRDLADDLTEATAAARAAETDAEKAAAKAAAKAAREQGGERLQEYLKRRAELRRRKRQLTRDNADAQAAKRAKIEDKIDEVQQADAAAVKVFSRRLKNTINQIDKNAPGRAQELLDSAVAEVERLNKLLASSEKRVAKLSEEPGEMPEGLANWIAGERAAAEAAARAARDMVDQLQDLAARGVSDAEFDDLRAALELKPVASRTDRLAAAEKQKGKREAKLAGAEKAVSERQQELAEAQRLAADLEKKLESITEGLSARSMRRGEYVQRQNERLARLTPEEIAAQNKARIDAIKARRLAAQGRHQERWGETDLTTQAREYAQEIYDKWTGRVAREVGLPPGVTKFAAGPLKQRSFVFPREELARRGWIETSSREIASRWSRSMAADIELTRRFGRADLEDQIREVGEEYSQMAVAVDQATTLDEISAILGQKVKGRDLATAKRNAAMMLDADRRGAVEDIQAGRDLLRGDYEVKRNSSNFASISRSLRSFNYILRMGGVALSSVQETFRPAMAHGLRPYLKGLPEGLAATFEKGGQATRLLTREAQLAGTISQRMTHMIAAANSDLGDPYITKMSGIERLLQKATQAGSSWNGINLLTDFQQGVAAMTSQHRIIETILGRAGQDGSFVKDKAEGRRLLAMLGIDDRVASDIKRLIEQHGEVVDGVQVPNTERWVTPGAVAEEFRTADRAVRAYRAAVNLDVNSMVSRAGLGDKPLFANTPLGALLFQFSGYAMGAHSRVMIRGLQEDKARFLSGLVVMSAMGGLTGWINSYRRIDQEKGAEQRQKWTDNPLSFAGEALDRSGLFPLAFDLSNRFERVSGAAGYEYRVNPLKSPLTALGGGDFFGQESSRASNASGVFSGLGGPTVGLIEGVASTVRVGLDAASRAAGGDAKTPDREVERALATIPFNSYYGLRLMTQMLFEGVTD